MEIPPPTALHPARCPIMVGLSGGVDSSVAALLLLEQGYRVEGLFMKNWEEDDDAWLLRRGGGPEGCDGGRRPGWASPCIASTSPRSTGIGSSPDFLAEYQANRTPNPDVLCNREIKFRAFLDHARDPGPVADRHWPLCATGDRGRPGLSPLFESGCG
jgi:tRNA-specific 2-thiouridylase